MASMSSSAIIMRDWRLACKHVMHEYLKGIRQR